MWWKGGRRRRRRRRKRHAKCGECRVGGECASEGVDYCLLSHDDSKSGRAQEKISSSDACNDDGTDAAAAAATAKVTTTATRTRPSEEEASADDSYVKSE